MHRDIKLENIMLKNQETLDIVLIDFGLAEYTTKTNYIVQYCGSKGYIAPEI